MRWRENARPLLYSTTSPLARQLARPPGSWQLQALRLALAAGALQVARATLLAGSNTAPARAPHSLSVTTDPAQDMAPLLNLFY